MTIEYTFSANETKMLPGGNFFMLLSTTDPVDVQLYKNGQKLEELADDVEAGYFNSPKNLSGGPAFDKVGITSATAQTVKALILSGQGGYNRTIGEMIINGFKTGVTLPDFTNPQNIINDVPLLGDTGHFRNSTSSALQTIVTPAANVNGIILTAVHVSSEGSGADVRVMAKSSAPSTWDDSAAISIAHETQGRGVMAVALPVKIPAGLGLYEWPNGGNISTCGLAYEVL